MPDIADIASEKEEILMRANLSQHREEGPAATGECLNCEERLPMGQRWCDAACRDDWEREYNRQENGG